MAPDATAMAPSESAGRGPVMVGWRRLPPNDGHAFGRVVQVGDARVFEGWEVVASASGGYAIRFRLVVGPDFVARALEVDADGPHGLHHLSVRRNPKGQWWADGKRRSDLDDCLDLDVAATPLTNTPAIRRLDLVAGESRTAAVAFVDVPGLTVGLVEQRYACLPAEDGVRRYRFTSGDFEAIITTDEDGIVRDYEGFASRAFRR